MHRNSNLCHPAGFEARESSLSVNLVGNVEVMLQLFREFQIEGQMPRGNGNMRWGEESLQLFESCDQQQDQKLPQREHFENL
jgi:hypothetical protein